MLVASFVGSGQSVHESEWVRSPNVDNGTARVLALSFFARIGRKTHGFQSQSCSAAIVVSGSLPILTKWLLTPFLRQHQEGPDANAINHGHMIDLELGPHGRL